VNTPFLFSENGQRWPCGWFAVFLPVMRRTSYVADYSAQHFSGYRKATMVVSVASTTTDGEEDRSTGVLIVPPSALVRSRSVSSMMPNGFSGIGARF